MDITIHLDPQIVIPVLALLGALLLGGREGLRLLLQLRDRDTPRGR